MRSRRTFRAVAAPLPDRVLDQLLIGANPVAQSAITSSELELALDRIGVALETTLRLHDNTSGAAAGDLEGAVASALAALSSADRGLLMLNAWDELTSAEIAVVLRRPVGVIRVRLHRARKRLRARLVDATDNPERDQTLIGDAVARPELRRAG